MSSKIRKNRLEAQKKYKNSKKGKETQARYYASEAKLEANRRYYKKYIEKVRAGKKLFYYVSRGYIKKMPCVECGDKNSQGHHEDYSKPLEVIWVCPYHHKQIHLKRATNESLSEGNP